MGASQHETQIYRQDGEQVDDAEETENVFLGMGRAVNPDNIFKGEECGENVFQNDENPLVRTSNVWHALQDEGGHAQHNHDHQGDVETFARRGVRLEDDVVQLVFQRFVFHQASEK